jgi:hypothetical protein
VKNTNKRTWTDLAFLALLLLRCRGESPHVVCCSLWCCSCGLWLRFRGWRFRLRFGLWQRLWFSSLAFLAFLLLACSCETSPVVLDWLSGRCFCWRFSGGGCFLSQLGLFFFLLLLLLVILKLLPAKMLASYHEKHDSGRAKPPIR